MNSLIEIEACCVKKKSSVFNRKKDKICGTCLVPTKLEIEDFLYESNMYAKDYCILLR